MRNVLWSVLWLTAGLPCLFSPGAQQFQSGKRPENGSRDATMLAGGDRPVCGIFFE